MSANKTYYKNTTRTISGLTNFVADNDVVLLCDTSSAPVNLTLLEIPQDFFSTTYKVYIVDKSNNALTNNITIKAPIGTTINNSSTAIINVNGGVAIVTISSNNTYNAQFNYNSGGGGGAVAILNEGVQITPNVSSIDFVGLLVDATAIGNNVKVNVNPAPPIAITYANLTTAIGSNTLIPSQIYAIQDAKYIQSIGVALPSASFVTTAIVYVVALSTNTITSYGGGLFLNPDFTGVGNYSGVPTFNSWSGIYGATGIYAIGDVVVWNNALWVNLTGSNTSVPSNTSVDWQFLPQTITTGYIKEICYIEYNVSNNSITARRDNYNNYVENNLVNYLTIGEAFLKFQWGNPLKTFTNTVVNGSNFEIWNNNGTIAGNEVKNQSQIRFQIFVNSGFLLSNVFNSAFVDLVNLGSMNLNTFQNIQTQGAVIGRFETRNSNSILNNNFFISLKAPSVQLYDLCNMVRNRVFGNVNNGNFLINLNATNLEENIFEKFEFIEINSTGGDIAYNVVEELGTFRVADNDNSINSNTISSGTLIILTINKGSIVNNSILNGGSLTIDRVGEFGIVQRNKIDTNSNAQINLLEGVFVDNVTYDFANLSIQWIDGINNPTTGKFQSNEIGNSSVVTIGKIDLGGTFWYNKFINGSFCVPSISPTMDISGNFQYNFCDNASIKIEAISIGINFVNNLVNNSSILTIEQPLNGDCTNNKIENKSTIATKNVLLNGQFNNNIFFASDVNITFISNNCIFEANTFNSSRLITKDINNSFFGNDIESATITILLDYNANFSQNKFKATSFLIDTVVPLGDGIAFNEILNCDIKFAQVSSFKNNKLQNSQYVLEDPITFTKYDIIKNFDNNVWNNVVFNLTGGNQNGNIVNTTINNGIFNLPNWVIGWSISGISQSGINTLSYIIDLADPTIYDPILKQLTIPSGLTEFIGVFVLVNGSGQVIEKIVQASSRYPITFITDSTTIGSSIIFRVINNQTAPILLNGIYSTTAGGYPQDYPITFQTITDTITLNYASGIINLITDYQAYP